MNSDKIKILGAGLSGLTAAINLAKADRSVEVFEKKADVGMHLRPNYQGLLRTRGDPLGYLRQFNLEPKFNMLELSKGIFCTRKREINVYLREPIPFIMRGGKDSLEYGLFRQAEALGVEFHFNSDMDERDANIVATGHYRVDMMAYGCVYENDGAFPEDKFVYMHDDRFSPIGWYLYITPLPGNLLKMVNCTSQPYVNETKKYYEKAVRERKIIRDIIGEKRPIESFGGYGGFDIPKTCVRSGVLYVGEAAGFQDPFRGFGMNHAIESGFLAAQSVIQGADYDRLWKERFKLRIKTDLYRRYAMRVFGDRAIEHAFKKLEDGDTVDFDKVDSKGIKHTIIRELFYRAERFRKWRTGYW